MVDLPPNGQKKKKNSRTMQMVFVVFYGRVTVEVGDNMFSIGKGGMWQVPRGWFFCPSILCVSFFDLLATNRIHFRLGIVLMRTSCLR